MIKNNKWKLIISSIVILLPTFVGFFGGRILPEEIIVHWGFDGKPDGWGSPANVFFVMPLILLAVHWLCMILSSVIDKNAERNKKIMGITFWIIPVISLMSCGVIFATALGYTSNIYAIVLLTIALAFIIIGNYLPKTTRNRTMGIKIKWALANDENWRATHRFGGKVWFFGGILTMLTAFWGSFWLLMAILGAMVILPTIYSYLYYKKHKKDEAHENG